MKKVLCLLLATSMALMVAGCSGEADTTKDANTTAATAPNMRVYELNGVEYRIPLAWETYEENENYYYYPEGNKNIKPGIIVVDRQNMQIVVKELAEDDWERDIPPEELNELGEAINNMVRENGGSDFVELVTESVHSVFYADHAVNEIKKRLLNGEIPHDGRQVWY